MSKSSATINRKFDPCLLGSKPDFTVMTTKPGNYIELLLGGIKPQKVKKKTEVSVLPEKVSPEIQVNTSNKACPPISILPNCVLFSDNDVDAGYYYDLSSGKNICKKSSLEHLHGPD
nr:8520_t:CDS:2 [Entrophospora candida]